MERHEAIYLIDSIEILRGGLPRRAHALVVEWTTLHRNELTDNWEKARNGLPVGGIEPLE